MMAALRTIGAALMCCAATTAPALTLDLPPSATLQRETTRDSYAVPTGRFDGVSVPSTVIEGNVTRQAWRIDSPDLTTLQIMSRLRDQLSQAGFDIVFTCATEACGGFDFRFGIDVMAPPDMFVDLGDFRFVAARHAQPGGPDAVQDGDDLTRVSSYVTLLVSRTSGAGFLQFVSAVPEVHDDDTPRETASPQIVAGAVGTDASVPYEADDFAIRLESVGRVILSDLTFDTGAARLGEGPFASLEALAAYLAARPARQVALVGHTDAAGSLDGNIALSRRRAESVLERLVSAHGVQPNQVEAQGMGYLAPAASNLTDAGREANRRVEVIVTSTD